MGLLYFVWYGLERSLLELLRSGWDWTFFGVPMAQLVGMGAAAAAIVAILIRHWYVRRHPTAEVDDAPPALPMEPAPTAGPEPTDETEPAPAV